MYRLPGSPAEEEGVRHGDAKIGAVGAGGQRPRAWLAPAWLLAQGPNMVPIPGTKRCAYLEENVGALVIELSREELGTLEAEAPRGAAAGECYAARMMALLDR